MLKEFVLCVFLVDSSHKSSPPSRLGPDIQTETAAQQPSSKIQTPDIPYKPEQRYATSNQGKTSFIHSFYLSMLKSQ